MQIFIAQFVFFVVLFISMPAIAADYIKNIERTFGCQIKFSALQSFYKNDSVRSDFKKSAWYDTDMNLRIKSSTFFSDNLSFNWHYVFSSSFGDTLEASEFYEQNPYSTTTKQVFQRNFDGDNTRLMDLSSNIKQGDKYFSSHSLDRLNLNFEGDFGKLIVGRQAVTWGNGLVFNPMDVFNPFSPYDNDKDYKKGEDMAFFETFFKNGNELQLLYVPRRNVNNGSVKFSNSSIAMKYHIFVNDMEFDFMAAKHYEDFMAGIGCVGILGDAVWRSDLVYTLAQGAMEDNLLSFVINMDYSWVWLKKNFYGFLEYHYSSSGIENDYSKIFTDHDLRTRASRGEIHGYGKNYLSTNLQIELNPLLNFNLLVITNLDDPSFRIQPVFTYSAAQNLEITLGSNIALGNKGDEYGQIQIPFSTHTLDSGSNLFFWATLFF